MEMITNILQQIQAAPISLLVILALNLLGIALWKVPRFPNGCIGVTLVALGAAAMFLCGDPGTVNPTVRFPDGPLLILGMIYGAAAWLLHGTILKRFLPAGILDPTDPNINPPPNKP